MNLSMKAQVWNQAGKSVEVADAIPGNDPKGSLNVKLAAPFGQDEQDVRRDKEIAVTDGRSQGVQSPADARRPTGDREDNTGHRACPGAFEAVTSTQLMFFLKCRGRMQR